MSLATHSRCPGCRSTDASTRRSFCSHDHYASYSLHRIFWRVRGVSEHWTKQSSYCGLHCRVSTTGVSSDLWILRTGCVQNDQAQGSDDGRIDCGIFPKTSFEEKHVDKALREKMMVDERLSAVEALWRTCYVAAPYCALVFACLCDTGTWFQIHSSTRRQNVGTK